MEFNLFKKKQNTTSNFDKLMNNPPTLDLPEKPTESFVPEPPKLELPPLKVPSIIPTKEIPEISAPVFEVPKINPVPEISKKVELPKLETIGELPKFPEDVSVKNTESDAPTPPAYFSKMGEVREDMAIDYKGDINLLKKPIFVEVNDYKKLRRTIKSMEIDANKSMEIVKELNKIKIKKENKLNGWDKQLETIQRNLIFTDKMLFEEGGPNV